jgi:hypothetical protein
MREFRCVIAFCLFSGALVAASNPFVGTWKLNSEKSKSTPGTATKEMTVTFEAVGDQIKRVATGIDADGQPVKQDSTIAWDGKDHPIDAPGMTVAVKRSKRSLDATVKHEGKTVDQIKATVSNSGKMMTIAEKGEDPKGRQIDNIEVYEKQ